MKLRIALAAFAAGLFAASASQAAGYYVSNLDEHSLEAIEVASITRNGDIATAWLITVLPKPSPNEKVAPTDFIVSYEDFDCKQMRKQRREIILYDLEGTVLVKGPAPGGWRPIKEGSRAKVTWEAVCFAEKRTGETREAKPVDLAKGYRRYLQQQK
jgi:hypothetical protein